MNLEDMGYGKDGAHNGMLTRAENLFLGILWEDHVGKERAIGADVMALMFDAALRGVSVNPATLPATILKMRRDAPRELDRQKRDVRKMHNHLVLIHERIPILSGAGPGGGYWIAQDKAEAEQFYETFRRRGFTGIVKATRGKRSAVMDVMTQLTFDFETITDRMGLDRQRPERFSDTLPAAMVDRFLTRMLERPERFADDLRRISAKFGGVLFTKGQAAAMKEKIAELNRLAEGL